MTYDYRIQKRNGWYRVQYKPSWWPLWFTKQMGCSKRTSLKEKAKETIERLKEKHQRKQEWHNSNWSTVHNE